MITSMSKQGGRHGILFDPGSVGNLQGDEWAKEISRTAIASGRHPEQLKRPKPLRVAGVGHGSQEATHDLRIPVCLKQTNGTYSSGTFEAPTIKNSNLPALLGLNTLEKLGAIVNFKTHELFIPGPGEAKLQEAMPSGTEAYQLEKAPSGHLLLPCSHYDEFDKQKHKQHRVNDAVALLTSPAEQ